MVEFRFLSEEEMRAANLYGSSTSVAVAEDDGRIVSMVSINTALRGTLCDRCTGSCATGGITWTAPDRRQEGLFIRLFNWAKQEAGIDKVYISQTTPEQLAVAAVHGLAVPKPGSVPSTRPISKAEDTSRILEGIQILESE